MPSLSAFIRGLLELLSSEGTAITLGAQPNQVDLLTSMSSSPTLDILERAETGELAGLEIRYVSLRDLLDAKREANRAKDRADIEELERLRHQAD